MAPVAAAVTGVDRFAGADIDAMLDVVDEGADRDTTAAAPGLDAIA